MSAKAKLFKAASRPPVSQYKKSEDLRFTAEWGGEAEEFVQSAWTGIVEAKKGRLIIFFIAYLRKIVKKIECKSLEEHYNMSHFKFWKNEGITMVPLWSL